MDGLDLLLIADTLREECLSRGLLHPRVAGLVASGGMLPTGVPLEVYVEPSQELAASDLGRISRDISNEVGWPILIWAVARGDERPLPDERVTDL